MATAGSRRERISLQRRALDQNGDPLGPWVEQAQCAAELRNLRGGEQVMGQRLQGVQPVLLTVLASQVSRLADNGWRAVNTRSRQIYDITSAVLSDDRGEVVMTATAKAAALTREGGDLTDG